MSARPAPSEPRFAVIASERDVAQAAERSLAKRYKPAGRDEADVLVVLGGDGFMLQTLHAMLDAGDQRPLFGMNRGTVGFLMNEWKVGGLAERLAAAKAVKVRPLAMQATRLDGSVAEHPAINEVSLLRQTRQAAQIELSVDGRVVMEELVCDGVLVATPAGSTAYNFSARGPILPLSANMLALTPIAPFRPRRWTGAILPDDVAVTLRVLEAAERPVAAVADQVEVRNVAEVRVTLDRKRALTLLFDPEHALDERIAMEQFLT
ncbi:NAD kinase [Sphingomonas mesophila]|uniref:NAD kinase n=1 Tax=Sphingomonas mesophila TaxID=2303576 RepID=UPI000E57DAB7|nr:NAD kinase [Sphingomonas mesophila]